MNRVRHAIAFAAFTLIGAGIIVRLVGAPNYPDAYYHFNAAARLASGNGLTDTHLWTYIGAPESGVLYPSHLYWMPLSSLIAAFGMALSGVPGSHAAAQLLFIPMLAGVAGIGFGLGWQLGKSPRHAWTAGLIALFSGYFVRFWGAMDTFTPFALVGALSLLLAGRVTAGDSRWWITLMAGVFAGLGHLTRADGVLLLLTAGFVWLVSRQPVRLIGLLILGYLIVMMPWFARNLAEIGSPLPLGGTMTMWIREYNELFSFPPTASPADLFADGLATFAATRWEAFVSNLGTFVAVEGMIAMTPLMLVALWRRRRDPFLRPFWLYALGLHAAMTIVFPLPGYRGGLFHSAAALVPWWAALGVLGVDDAVDWMAKRRRWRPQTAKGVFSAALVGLALMLSVLFGSAGRVPADAPTPAFYTALDAILPPDARLMINDPAGLYYHTGRGGVVLPNSPPDVIPEIAARYHIDYLVLESPEAVPAPLMTLFDTTPDYLIPIPFDGGARVYAIAVD
ncbi:MAG: hypothetical protein CUN53_05080 [Phototrophicales bacterium]|nr:MAG: hypothetical protein CUN53_05080 [Phototrophicales bacterium]